MIDFSRIRLLPVFLLFLLIFLQYRLWFEPQGLVEMLRLKKQLAVQQMMNEQLKQRNALMREEVSHLQRGGDAIESKARQELGMIRKGEVFYHENIAE